MATDTFQSLAKQVVNKQFFPIYLLHGQESYYIDKLSDLIVSKALDESEREFNQSILYGKETNVGHVIECAKRYPMMASRQVVIIKEAQFLHKIEELVSYLKNPSDTTVLVICYKGKALDKRKTIYKELEKSGVVFESKKMYDNQIPQWITDYVIKSKRKISPKASMILTEHCGNELGNITNELGKLFINCKEGEEISPAFIEEHVGISKDYNIFELTNAIGARNISKANKITNHFAHNTRQHPFVVTLTLLYGYFSKLLLIHFSKDKSQGNLMSILKVSNFHLKGYLQGAGNYNPKKLVGIIELLKAYDLKSKGVENPSTNEGELLKELVFQIMH